MVNIHYTILNYTHNTNSIDLTIGIYIYYIHLVAKVCRCVNSFCTKSLCINILHVQLYALLPTIFHGHRAAAGSTLIHSAKVDWADDSKKGVSFVSGFETTVQFGSRNGEDTGSIHESDLEMKHNNVDEHAS